MQQPWRSNDFVLRDAGIVWSLWWEKVLRGIAAQNPDLAVSLDPRRDELTGTAVASKAGSAASQAPAAKTVPWRGFIRNQPLQALAYTHFCNNWWVAFAFSAPTLLSVCVCVMLWTGVPGRSPAFKMHTRRHKGAVF